MKKSDLLEQIIGVRTLAKAFNRELHERIRDVQQKMDDWRAGLQKQLDDWCAKSDERVSSSAAHARSTLLSLETMLAGVQAVVEAELRTINARLDALEKAKP